MTGNQGHLSTSPVYTTSTQPRCFSLPTAPGEVREGLGPNRAATLAGSRVATRLPWPSLQANIIMVGSRHIKHQKKSTWHTISKSIIFHRSHPNILPLQKNWKLSCFFASQSCSQSLAWQRNCGNQNNPRLRRLRRPPEVSTSARKTNVQHPVREPNLIGPLPRTEVGLPFMFEPLTSSFDVFFFFSSHGAFSNGKA